MLQNVGPGRVTAVPVGNGHENDELLRAVRDAASGSFEVLGELGAGKTTLAKGIVSGLGAAREEEVTSPTFTLVHVFHNHQTVYHVDLYRITSFRDLETLGLEDVFDRPAVVLIEWAEKFTLRTDWPVVRIHLEHAGEDRRRIRVEDSAGVLVAAEAAR